MRTIVRFLRVATLELAPAMRAKTERYYGPAERWRRLRKTPPRRVAAGGSHVFVLYAAAWKGTWRVVVKRAGMFSSELRRVEAGDAIAHARLMSHAFGRGGLVADDAEKTVPDVTFGCFSSGDLQASLTIEPFHIYWGPDTILPMGGIAGVATFAEARGQGLVEQLLRQSLVAMRDAGQCVSSLYPFAWAFYRRAGWDWVGEKRDITLPPSAISKHKIELPARLPGTPAERATALHARYEAFARRYRGGQTASTRRWGRQLDDSDNRSTYAYAIEDGYAAVRFGKSETIDVREYVASTPDADRALLELFRAFGTQVKKVSLTLPADHPLWAHVYHWDIETKIEPVFMGRVVDFCAATAQLPPVDAPDGAIVLRLSDTFAPWNDGLFRLRIESGKRLAEPLIGASEPAVELDIQTLSQAFWGTPSVAALRAAGRVSCDGPTFEFLGNFFDSHPVMTWDDF